MLSAVVLSPPMESKTEAAITVGISMVLQISFTTGIPMSNVTKVLTDVRRIKADNSSAVYKGLKLTAIAPSDSAA